MGLSLRSTQRMWRNADFNVCPDCSLTSNDEDRLRQETFRHTASYWRLCTTWGAERKDQSARKPRSSCLNPDAGCSPTAWKMFPDRFDLKGAQMGFIREMLKLLDFFV